MPGGDRDTWRPYSKRYDVCFAGRKGYARLAIKAGVPIVPIANADNAQHGPDENLRLGNLWYGVDLVTTLLTQLFL